MTETATITNETTVVEEVLDPRVLADLMAALERVFKIGVYYPSGHSMCDQAADGFLSAMARTLGKAPSLLFEAVGGKLILQGSQLEPDMRGVDTFLDLLGNIGIARVEMESNVSAADLHEFVTRLLKYRNDIRGARDFQQVVVEGMPLTISVEHLEFRTHELDDVDPDGEGSGDRSQPTVEVLLAALARQGLSPEELSRCRKLLESIPAYLKNTAPRTGSMPRVSWSEVEKLLIKAAQSGPAEPAPDAVAPAERAGTHDNLDALTSIFRSLGRRKEEENPNEAIDLLLKHLHRPTPKNEGGEAKTKPKPKPKPMSELKPMDELLSAIEACVASAETEEPRLLNNSRAEELSILLQMLGGEPSRKLLSRVQKRLQDIGRTTLLDSEWHIAVEGVRGFLDPAQGEHGAASLQLVLDAVRGAGMQSTLAFLHEVSNGCSPEQIEILWPFLLNEVLLEGRSRQPEAFEEVCILVGQADRDAVRKRLPRLEQLEALRRKRCVRDVVMPVPKELRDVLAALAASPPGSFLAPRIFDGLKRHPQGWVCRAVMPLLKKYDPRYRRFVIQLVAEAGSEDVSEPLAEAASRIAGEFLPQLSQRRRHENWVPDTLRALGRMRTNTSRQVLNDILSARQLLIFHVWPVACRHAARGAINQLNRRPDEGSSADRES